MSDFFQSYEISKCDCNLESKTNFIEENEFQRIEGTGKDTLIILEMYESEESMDWFYEFLIKEKSLRNFTLISALRCQPKGFEIPSPSHKYFSKCGIVETYLNTNDYPIILTVGKALFSITKNSDIATWEDFYEYLFNDTFFYTGYEEKSTLRRKVYPLPPLYKVYNEKATRIGLLNKLKENFESEYLSIQLRKVRKENKNFTRIKKFDIQYIENPNEFLLTHTKTACPVALDTETNSLDHYSEGFRIGCLTLSFDGVTGYYLPFEKIDWKILNDFLENKHQIWANGSYDLKAFYLHKAELKENEQNEKLFETNNIPNLRIDDDIVNLLHVLDSNKTRNGLKTQAWFLGFGGYDDKLDKYKEKFKVSNYLEIPESILMEYAVIDAIVTYRAWEKLISESEKQPLVFENYRKRIIPALPIYIEASVQGMIIDEEHLNSSTHELQERIKVIEKDIYKLLGKEFKIGSDEQLALILEKKGFKDYGRTKKGHFLTNEKILLNWKKDGHHEIIDKILEYREVTKLVSTFLGETKNDTDGFFDETDETEGIAKHIKRDGKVHSEFMVAMTDSGRIKGKNPNLLNLPKHGNEAKMIRKLFKPREGYIYGEADFSGFQLRIMAEYSQDEEMLKVFNELSGDLHSVTAQSIFLRNMPLEEVLQKKKTEKKVKQARTNAKTVAFSLLFGAKANTLKSNALDNKWSDEEVESYIKENNLKIIKNRRDEEEKFLTVAEDLRNKFFETYSLLLPTIESYHSLAEKNGFVDSPFGGRRHLPQLTKTGYHSDKGEISNLHNIAINSPTQNFEAMYMFSKQIEIYKYLKDNNLKTKIVNSVYDSILFEFHKDEVKKLVPVIFNIMEDYTNYTVPITIEQDLGGYWGFPDVDVDRENIHKIFEYVDNGFKK